MNIEIANRLVELRKKNNLSQEALAEKLGISRQAVSKWERAEASPDMDNVIMLSRIYHMSLDELLKTDEEEAGLQEETACGETLSGEGIFPGGGEMGSEEGISLAGEVSGEAAPSPVVVCENPGSPAIEVWAFLMKGLPLGVIVTEVYLFIGCVWHLWHPGWLLFLLPPILESLATAIRKKNANYFAYPVLVSFIYLVLGICLNLWHPGWLIFMTVPIYYSLLNYIRRLVREQDKELGL